MDYFGAKIAMIIAHKGLLIGFGLGLFKMMQSIRAGNVRVVIIITDFVGSMLMGYGAWELCSAADLSVPITIGMTVILSLNAFLAIHVFTNPSVLKSIIKSVFKIDVSGAGNEK